MMESIDNELRKLDPAYAQARETAREREERERAREG